MAGKALRAVIHRIISSRREFILYSFTQLLIVGLNLVNNIIIARRFSIREYGVYSLCTIVLSAAVTLGISWSSSSIVYYGSKERADTGRIGNTFWARTILLLLSMSIVVIVFLSFEDRMNDYLEEQLSMLLLLWVMVRSVEDHFIHYFLAVKKQMISGYIDLSARVTLFILLLVLSSNLRSLIILCVMCDLVSLVFIGFINKREIGRPTLNKKLFKEILHFSLWQLIGFSGLSVINFGDAIVIKHFMSIEDVGLYNSAYKLFNSVAGLSYAISAFYGANVAECIHRKYKDRLRKFFYKERFIILTASCILHLFIIALSDQIVLFVYGEKYLGASVILKILMVGSIFKYFSVFYMLYYNSAGRYRMQQSINLIRAFINITLDILLVKRYALAGPAAATTIAAFTAFLLSFLQCEKSIRKECFTVGRLNKLKLGG